MLMFVDKTPVVQGDYPAAALFPAAGRNWR